MFTLGSEGDVTDEEQEQEQEQQYKHQQQQIRIGKIKSPGKTHTYTCTHAHSHTHVRPHTHTHTHTYTNTHTHIHTHTHTHIHTHTHFWDSRNSACLCELSFASSCYFLWSRPIFFFETQKSFDAVWKISFSPCWMEVLLVFVVPVVLDRMARHWVTWPFQGECHQRGWGRLADEVSLSESSRWQRSSELTCISWHCFVQQWHQFFGKTVSYRNWMKHFDTVYCNTFIAMHVCTLY